MFAVVQTGGKQYKVTKDDVIKVEKLDGAAGDTIKLADVLLVGDDKGTTIGDPLLKGTVVTARILEQTRADKIIVFKKKRRQGYRRKAGHRQSITVLKITAIGGGKATAPAKDKTPAKDKAPAKAEAKAETKPAAKKTEAKGKAPAKTEATTKKAAATKSKKKDS